MPDRPCVALQALGCRVSRSDLDALATLLEPHFALASPGERADYVVLSTCTVTADADAAARQALRRALREHPGAAVVATGCYAQLRPEELSSLGAASVVGARSPGQVRDALLRLRQEREGAASSAAGATGLGGAVSGASAAREPGAPRGEAGWPVPRRPFGHTRAFLKVQDGCDWKCSYCAVPSARGAARSLPFEAALAAVAALARESPEVVLTGVHLGLYGRDLTPRRSLLELVEAIAARGLARRVRLSSVELQELSSDLFRGPARALLCEHVHVPLQSGSPDVLARMRRPASPGAWRERLEGLAAAAPGLCIGADLMTGFPGEREGDHEATVALVERLPLAYLHVFPFSPRPGTDAAASPGQVPAAVARERARDLLDRSARRWQSFCEAQRGRTLEVAVERVRGGVASGTARNYATVRWPASDERRGELALVRVTRVDREACVGERAGGALPHAPGGVDGT